MSIDEFTKFNQSYRVRIDLFDEKVSYVSNETFETYEEAWNYAKIKSVDFGNCGFCVIYDDVPELNITIPFDDEGLNNADRSR